MGTFYETDLGLSSMTSQELDAIALERAGIVGSIGYGYATCGEVGQLAGGWTAQWIACGGMGNCGTLVLVPQDVRTRAIAREGKVRAFMNEGLTREQAERLHHSNLRYKFELAGTLARVLACKAQTLAFLAHPGKYGYGSGRSKWHDAWGSVLSPEVLGLSAPREVVLAEMVAICAPQAMAA
jgi:hypothetical protein